ncbi:serine/threonine-protein kinase [Tuwongella immobilis]|uniref:Protein kinase domain-containing protein n=1 Tax=Tuwongella immobilis TaxID=692036 RepID=A0A6C2YU55_9BACT|nr:serine/threonine-protein kinase [Tuwongella immobilis]VIP05170.1 serine threonine protein kinase : Serine/threonine protein kinase OS=uncultured planctomycete GN=HGMM_F33C03C32 PE=4 SV=1: Pkinase: TPR_12: TPR_12: TPR_10: TPR_12 [Tuwongella immobilis]VTS07696.1 serine threonine protein kinase : Serine/threonine protein kinase OS=uncultured planctomycete GN=HGMM_F33C03C32 PE=4 SV=1: Pkinase: TPR_12: TPR_12: TPR_10: TPR_12 [Tuwongella immobilis]
MSPTDPPFGPLPPPAATPAGNAPQTPPNTPSATAATPIISPVGTPNGTPVGSSTQPHANIADAPEIPGYTITEFIAQGGMGRVFGGMDRQLQREVAIKTLRAGANADRFLIEAKITAQLPHPGIPPVYAIGTLPGNLPWLAMKRIRGQTLEKLLRSRPNPSSDLPKMLVIFEQIAQAVGFAHRHGIIHRDIKPLNVMVGEFGEVQVMDWGLAKSRADSTADTPPESATPPEDLSPAPADLTRPGAILGTPSYLSPEQAAGHSVDARTDVFALGSLLTMILTGHPAYVSPFVGDIVAMARDANLADARNRLLACGCDPELAKLALQLLAPNRDDRPADGHIVAEAIASYRAQLDARLRLAETTAAESRIRNAEQAKRRRLAQIAGGTLVAVLLIGIAGTSWGLWQANLARAAESERANAEAAAKLEAQEQRQQAETARLAAESARQTEAQQRRFAESIADFVQNDILALASSESQIRFARLGSPQLSPNLTMRELLQRAAKRLRNRQDLDPATEAELCWMIGVNFRALGAYPQAIEFLQRSRTIRRHILGPDDPVTLNTENSLAFAMQHSGQVAEAIQLTQQILERQRKTLGPTHELTLTSQDNLGRAYIIADKLPEAIAELEFVRDQRMKTIGPTHEDTLTTLANLGVAFQKQRRFADAAQLFKEVREVRLKTLGTEHPDTLTVTGNLAANYFESGNLQEAIPHFQTVHRASDARLGPDDPASYTAIHNLTAAYLSANRLDDAMPLLEQLPGRAERIFGPLHADTLEALRNLAAAYQKRKQPRQWIATLEILLPRVRQTTGNDSLESLVLLNRLAGAYLMVQQYEQAVPLFESIHPLVRKRFGPNHENTIDTLGNLGQAYLRAKQPEKGLLAIREFIAGQRELLAKQPAALGQVLVDTSRMLLETGQPAAAEPWLRESLGILEKATPKQWTNSGVTIMLGTSLLMQKKLADAEPLLLSGYEGLLAARNAPSPPSAELFRETIDRIIVLYTLQKQPDKVAHWKSQREQWQPPTNPDGKPAPNVDKP